MNGKKIPIAVAAGDGIGPEIMAATLEILQHAGADLDIKEVEIGEKYICAASPQASIPPPGRRLERPKPS